MSDLFNASKYSDYCVREAPRAQVQRGEKKGPGLSNDCRLPAVRQRCRKPKFCSISNNYFLEALAPEAKFEVNF